MNKPTLRYIWLNEVEVCNEEECENCDHLSGEGAHHDEPSWNYCELSDSSEECSECPAVMRIFADFMNDYKQEQDTEVVT